MKLRAIVLVFGLISACGKKEESAHMKRARELLSIGEWANARTELKLEVKDHSRETEARGLLLYCIDREDGLDKVADFGMLELYALLNAPSSPDWDKAPKDTQDFVNKILIETRQKLYDKSVDTKDSADLSSVILAAARFGFEKDDDQDRKDAYAAILARSGDGPSLQYLVERLKSQNPDLVVDYLASVGSGALQPLQKVLADRSFIGHVAALAAVARIQAASTARAFVAENKDLRDPTSQPGTDKLGHSFVAGRGEWAPQRVHAQYAAMDKDVDGLLVLQSWNEATKSMAVGAYAFKDGAMKRLRVTTADGKTFELGGPSAVYGLQTEAGVVKLRRTQQQTTMRDVETGEVTKPTVGLKVRLNGYKQHGEIVRQDDGGLWVVKVDAPIEGMNELTVAATSMIGLRTEPFTQTSTELLTAKVSGGDLQITQRATASDTLAMFAQVRDEMCACAAGDRACATKVQQEMQAYVDEHNGMKDEAFSDSDLKKANEIAAEMTKCSASAFGVRE
jgi:hypothetical protein